MKQPKQTESLRGDHKLKGTTRSLGLQTGSIKGVKAPGEGDSLIQVSKTLKGQGGTMGLPPL